MWVTRIEKREKVHHAFRHNFFVRKDFLQIFEATERSARVEAIATIFCCVTQRNNVVPYYQYPKLFL